MYFSILGMKEQGLKITQIARKLEVSRNTVYKFLEMNPDEFSKYLEQLETRQKKLDGYESSILQWLREYPDLSAAQIHDWLKERFQVQNISEGTVRNYVRDLRKKYNIPKVMQARQYEAVQDPPPGYQLQVDFGETKLRNLQGNLVRLWFMGFVLSHSRHKYVQWLDRPFTTKDVVDMHEEAFAFFGGIRRRLFTTRTICFLPARIMEICYSRMSLQVMLSSGIFESECAGNKILKVKAASKM
ncbi:helix-turn-helix domain-containing protein [Paenibacillus hexagrammi]|uniref:Helix-turn-helix domain-containing protein n=1 Tax=Paenibacillus hexagrammi TaxID=2908839 RepID=A0ABY3SQ49_9BACL|nr:helix-turn-helix domain-containing protein [Paenibacillus sp. YPD9-1]UJF35520.1 helix-turn-helix domain-containing protein [Paenibacillus sp. YPD9-1]